MWSEQWLKFNEQKCKVMHCGSSNPKTKYQMNGKELQTTDAESDLGIKITSDLKPSSHCQRAASRAMAALRVLRSCFDRLTERNFTGLFNSYVRPHLDYCIQAVGPQAVQDLDLLENVQRRASKLAKELRHLSYPDRLKKLVTTTIRERLRRGDLIETYKILTGKLCIRRDKFFEKSKGTTRGHYLKIDKKLVTHQARSRFFSQRVVNSWNGLPKAVVSAKTTEVFKTRLDKCFHLPVKSQYP